jgi:hypothetical protein
MRSPSYLVAALALPLAILACVCCGPPPNPEAGRPIIPTRMVVPPTAASETAAPSPVVQPPTEGASSGALTVAVIVDTRSESVSRAQAQEAVDEAGRLLRQLTPFTIVMTDFSEDGGGGSTNDMASRYIAAHTAALPNAIVLFSYGDGGQARLQGGYNYAIAAPAGYRNTFASPVTGANQVYVAVVHFSHRYAECGYGGADTVQSSTSLDGECRNQPGTPCVQQNGYSMCQNAVGDLYMTTPTYFVASTIVHELLHPFASSGDADHYNTPECNARMGYPPGFFDLLESQYHNGLCPDVYDNFIRSYQP